MITGQARPPIPTGAMWMRSATGRESLHRRRQPGSGFDLSWAVDADGTRWSFNSVNYVKVMTASHIDGGAIRGNRRR